MLCPECGKAMREQPTFKGLWMCPDYEKPINQAPPFEFKCKGMVLTQEGSDAFDAELRRRILESN